MKRAVPVFLLVLVLLGLVGGGFWLYKAFTKPVDRDGGGVRLRALSSAERPFVSLVPGASCKYTLKVDGIIDGVESLEYEIVYKTEDGVTQGVPGRVVLGGKKEMVREVLFGTESSGSRRCDKGVNSGSIGLTYWDSSGQQMAEEFTHKFDVFDTREEDYEVFEIDGFSMTAGESVSGKYVLMESGGMPRTKTGEGATITGSIIGGPYSVYWSGGDTASGVVEFAESGNVYAWNGDGWTEPVGGKTTFLGTYILVSS